MDNQTNNNQMIEEIIKLNERIAKLETKLDSNQNKQISNFQLAFEGIGSFFFGVIAVGPALVLVLLTIQYIYESIKNNVSFHYFYENLNGITVFGLFIILAIIFLLINKAIRIGSTKQTN
ncbi:hypothetical protein J5Y03_14105 [Bacillus sp. RG28]|uniref:Uncharacterized protein n=1 Tax=Gottfriedia endophytica TaxID=2820819 RepID=A0A940SJR0_9BACI|nr:hypothetical protein [Gottfriedia endophytica]MBP0726290.1 hypothetical protein [Gottfriedia endophytica]